MRPIERIDYFLNNVDLDNLFDNIWKIDKTEYLENIIKNLKDIGEMWKLYPDLRISQVLVNNGFIPNIPGSWYYLEDWEILFMQGDNPRNFLFWGSKVDGDVKWILIKDMTTQHIQNILKDYESGKLRVHSMFLEAFKKELEFNFKSAN